MWLITFRRNVECWHNSTLNCSIFKCFHGEIEKLCSSEKLYLTNETEMLRQPILTADTFAGVTNLKTSFMTLHGPVSDKAAKLGRGAEKNGTFTAHHTLEKAAINYF